MSALTGQTESRDRRRNMLRTAMGAEIAAALNDPVVIEVMVNPDGALRLDRLGEGRIDTGTRLAAADVERIIRLVASHVRLEAHANSPVVSAELPPREDNAAGERFEGLLPPVSVAPCFTIRKPARRIYTLDDYVSDRIVSAPQADALRRAVCERKNILVAGGTSSGKTTLANALLAEIATRDERVIILEDTRELQCAAPDCVALRTRAGSVSFADLVRSTLRLRPDRIIVGEVRGAEALDMLKAWNTGHPGGIATVHANSASSALYRIEQLVQETVVTVPRRLIAEAIDLVVFIAGRGTRTPHRDHCRGPRAGRRRRLRTYPIRSPKTPRPLIREESPCRSHRLFVRSLALAIAVQSMVVSSAYAAGTNMPWEQPLQQILDSVQGPVAKIIAVIIIIITGLTLAFGETAGGFRRLIQIVFGLSIAFAASSFFLSFFSFGGGALVRVHRRV